MKILSVFRSPGTTWLVAVASVPFFMLGLDLLLLPIGQARVEHQLCAKHHLPAASYKMAQSAMLRRADHLPALRERVQG